MPRSKLLGLRGQCDHTFDAKSLQGLNWGALTFFDIQAEGLLIGCAGAGTDAVSIYAKFVSDVAAYVRSKNSNIVVVTQLSFRFTAPELMIQAIQQTKNLVNRFFLSYPLAADSRYSTAANLENVLKAFRAPRVTELP